MPMAFSGLWFRAAVRVLPAAPEQPVSQRRVRHQAATRTASAAAITTPTTVSSAATPGVIAGLIGPNAVDR